MLAGCMRMANLIQAATKHVILSLSRLCKIVFKAGSSTINVCMEASYGQAQIMSKQASFKGRDGS